MNNDVREPNAEERIYFAFALGKDFIERTFHIVSQVCPHINIHYYTKIAVKLLDYEIITEAKDSDAYRRTFELLKNEIAGMLGGDTSWLNIIPNPSPVLPSSTCVVYNICFRFIAVFLDHLQQNIKEDENKKIEQNLLGALGERTCECPAMQGQPYPLRHIFQYTRKVKLSAGEHCFIGEGNNSMPTPQNESLFKQRGKWPQMMKTAELPLQKKESFCKKTAPTEMPGQKRFLGRNLTDDINMPAPPPQPAYVDESSNEVDTTYAAMASQLEAQAGADNGEQMPGSAEFVPPLPNPSGFKIPSTMKLSVQQREGLIKKNSQTGPVPQLPHPDEYMAGRNEETAYDMALHRTLQEPPLPEQDMLANNQLQPRPAGAPPIMPKLFKSLAQTTGPRETGQQQQPIQPLVMPQPQPIKSAAAKGEETGVIFDMPAQTGYPKTPGETGVIFDMSGQTGYPKTPGETGVIFEPPKKSMHTPTKMPSPISQATPILRQMDPADAKSANAAGSGYGPYQTGQPATAPMSQSQFMGTEDSIHTELVVSGQAVPQNAKSRPQSGRIPKIVDGRLEPAGILYSGYLAAGDRASIAAQIAHSISLTQATRNKFYNPHIPKNKTASWQQYLCGRTIRNGLLLPRGYQQNQATLNTINIKKLLGRGGNGEVYLVEYGLLADFKYVLKLPLPPLEMNVPLFLEEIVKLKRVKAISNMHLPKIVASDFQFENESIPFYLMHELQPIERLFGAVKKTPLYPPSCLMFFYCLLRALRDLSLHHIIHCDIKPENILFYREIPMLMDFGASRTYDEINELELGKKTGLLHGTPTYLPPEVVQMEQRMDGPHVVFCMDKISQKIDIWALGLVFMYWLTGKTLFENINLGNNLLEMFERICQQFQDNRLAQYRHECERTLCRLYLGSDAIAMNRLREADIQKYYVNNALTAGAKDNRQQQIQQQQIQQQRFRGIDFRGGFFTDIMRIFDMCTAPYHERLKPLQLLNEVEKMFPWINEKYEQMITDLFVPPLEEYQKVQNTNIEQEAGILKKLNQFFPPKDQ